MTRSEAHHPAVIIGAGVTGLNCAKQLEEQGVDFQLLEASDGIGGRVRTDFVEQCRLDRGFQVFQTAYPEAKSALNYAELDLVELEPGALVRYHDRWCRMSDPFRRPRHAWQTLFNPIGGIGDRLKLLWLQRKINALEIDDWLQRSQDESTESFLRDACKFSDGFIEGFMRPWLSGIFLEKELATSANYFAFVFQMLSAGPIAYPKLGMQAIPDQLAASMPSHRLRLNCPVERVEQNGEGQWIVRLESGEAVNASAVVLATDVTTASKLTGGSVADRAKNGTVCIYYLAERPPINEPILLLNGESEGPVNHLFVPTNAVPSLAPEGKSLISVSLVGEADYDSSRIEKQLTNWFGGDVTRWRELQVYKLPHALPQQRPGFYTQRETPDLPAGMFPCGDFLETTSVNGALKSGREAARKAIRYLKAHSSQTA